MEKYLNSDRACLMVSADKRKKNLNTLRYSRHFYLGIFMISPCNGKLEPSLANESDPKVLGNTDLHASGYHTGVTHTLIPRKIPGTNRCYT